MHSSGDDRCARCAGPPCAPVHGTRPVHPAASHSPPSCSGAAHTAAPAYDAAPRAVAHDAAPHLSRCALRRKWATRGPAHCVGSYGITAAAHRPVRTLACPCAPAHDARSPAHANRSFAFHSSHIRAPLSAPGLPDVPRFAIPLAVQKKGNRRNCDRPKKCGRVRRPPPDQHSPSSSHCSPCPSR
mgnify:CR=1 FL=1